jgi:hypothetical protein
MHQFTDCGHLQKSTSGTMKPDIGAMMSHILNSLWALIKLVDSEGFRNSERFKIFTAAVGMMSKLAANGLLSSIEVELSQPPSNTTEDDEWSPSKIEVSRHQGLRMQSICDDEARDGCFWIPLFFSAIIENAPKDFYLGVSCLHDEFSEMVGNDRSTALSPMEVLLGSDRVSDTAKMHILRVLYKKEPGLFFANDYSNESAIFYAARLCSPLKYCASYCK